MRSVHSKLWSKNQYKKKTPQDQTKYFEKVILNKNSILKIFVCE